MATIGSVSVFVALVVAIYTTFAAVIGARRRIPELTSSARNGILAYAALMTIAIGTIVIALYTHDFSIALVANSTSRELQTIYTVTALWSNQAGSLLFWSWILSLYSAVVVLLKWERDRDLMPYVIATLMAIQTFFAFMLSFISSPFAHWWDVGGKTVMALFPPAGARAFIPADGQGLNPLLQHPAMAMHPPMLYLGYVGFTIPFAFAMAALITGRLGPAWLRTTRRWTIAPWMFLSIGLLLGGRWAYDVLGWGGYWGWDPVENAAFMPWLAGTAFLHSVMVQERKGMLKVWNIGLIIITFSLVLFGTFLTRSGVITSVHSFTESDIGVWFLTFIAGVTLAATLLLFTRIRELRSERDIDSLLSREAFFLLNNLLFVGAAFAVLWGTIYPLFSELVLGNKLTVGPPYFNQVAAPIFGAILLVMAIIPLIGWGGATGAKLLRKLALPTALALALAAVIFALGVRDIVPLAGYFLALLVIVSTASEVVQGTFARAKNTHEFFFTAMRGLIERNRRRYGGYLIHIAAAMMAIGIIGSQVYATDSTRALKTGESLDIRGYTLTYENLSPNFPSSEGQITSATIGVFRDGKRVATLSPSRGFYPNSGETATTPAILSTPQEDLYVIIAGWEDNFATVTFRAYVNPLVFWLWFGGFCLVVSTLIAAWPDAREEARVHVEGLAKEAARA
ncbi:MAG: heme lyase CcmF/NrfE family subunit [Chloroflexota bacterium]|nr:heme lyase CcmF/NrfE family subunit [Chloroflexota bacterium]